MVWQVLAVTEHGSNDVSSWRHLSDGFIVFRVELEEYRCVVGHTF